MRFESDQYVWSLRHFPQDTAYFDEPSELIPAGYYVVGHRPTDEPENPRIVMHVDASTDGQGRDSREQTAQFIISTLNAASDINTAASEGTAWGTATMLCPDCPRRQGKHGA